jgi:hypothetical protein
MMDTLNRSLNRVSFKSKISNSASNGTPYQERIGWSAQRSIRHALAMGALTITCCLLSNASAMAQQRNDGSTQNVASTNAVAQSNASSGDGVATEMRLRDGSVVPMGDYVGMWQGIVRTSTGTHRVALEVAPRTIGDGLVASMTSSAQRPFSVLVDTVTVADHHVQMGMATAGTRFTGRVNDRQTEIRGNWIQDGKSYSLTLKRVVVPVRTEHPIRESDLQAMMTYMQQPFGEAPTSDQPVIRRRPVFMIGPAHKPVAYDWIPHVGNQTVSYGMDYW